MAYAGQDVVMTFAPMGGLQDALRRRADFEDPGLGMVERAHQA